MGKAEVTMKSEKVSVEMTIFGKDRVTKLMSVSEGEAIHISSVLGKRFEVGVYLVNAQLDLMELWVTGQGGELVGSEELPQMRWFVEGIRHSRNGR